MLETSPFGGVTIRQRQSSLTIDTHVPVRSAGASWRPVCGGPPARPCPATSERPTVSVTANIARPIARAALKGRLAQISEFIMNVEGYVHMAAVFQGQAQGRPGAGTKSPDEAAAPATVT